MLEEKLKNIIIEKYGSIRQFSIKINVPYTTVDSILKRGIDNSNVENVIKICNALNVSIDDLLNKKKIVSVIETEKNFVFGNEIENILEVISNELNLPIETVKTIFLNTNTSKVEDLNYANVKQHIQDWIKYNPKKKIMLDISKKEWEYLENDLKNQDNILNTVSENIYIYLNLNFEYHPNTTAEINFELNSYSNIQKLYDTLISLNLIKKGRLLKDDEFNNIISFINNNSNMLKQILDNNYKEHMKEWNNFVNSSLYKDYINELEES